ncbi:MAG TPA: hypothetical protein V6D33_07065 [Cyanophyceae cyanobacterium]
MEFIVWGFFIYTVGFMAYKPPAKKDKKTPEEELGNALTKYLLSIKAKAK